MAAFICGSMAFDSIMSFEGRFSDQILPDQLHILNVSFLVPTLRRDFGGYGRRRLPCAFSSDGHFY
jgi:adenosine kinase